MAPKESSEEVHFRELRRRIFTWFGTFVIAFLVACYHSKDILNLLLSYGEKQELSMQFAYLYPQEIFMQYLSISVSAAFLTTLPILTLQIAL